MKVFFLAALLVLGAIAEDDGQAVIKKLEGSDFGRQMMNTIQLQLESGDPADDLVKMLQDEEDRLEREQDVDDAAVLIVQNQCVADLANYVEEIADTRKRIQELDDLIEELKPIKAAKLDEKAKLEDFQALLEQKLKELDEAKAEKDAEWKSEAGEHDALTAIVQKAKNIIQGALSSSFLQTDTKSNTAMLAQLGQHFNNAKKTHYKRKTYNSVFRILAQISTSAPVQANQGVVDRIMDICDELLNKIAESRAIEKRDYDHWVNEYTKTKTTLQGKLADTKAKIAQLVIDISILTKRIGIAEAELADQKVRLEQKITQHDERETFCDNEANRYAKDREARSDQREIISDAIGLLVSKIRLLKRYVSDRVQTLDRPVL